jgi:hypothetical protein
MQMTTLRCPHHDAWCWHQIQSLHTFAVIISHMVSLVDICYSDIICLRLTEWWIGHRVSHWLSCPYHDSEISTNQVLTNLSLSLTSVRREPQYPDRTLPPAMPSTSWCGRWYSITSHHHSDWLSFHLTWKRGGSLISLIQRITSELLYCYGALHTHHIPSVSPPWKSCHGGVSSVTE